MGAKWGTPGSWEAQSKVVAVALNQKVGGAQPCVSHSPPGDSDTPSLQFGNHRFSRYQGLSQALRMHTIGKNQCNSYLYLEYSGASYVPQEADSETD